jgi:predicted acylesterase/phospholipase RssA
MSGLTEFLRLPLGIVGRPSRDRNGKGSGTHAKAQTSNRKPNAQSLGSESAQLNGTGTDDLDLQRWPYFVGSPGERDKIALVLAGGGITGAFYEIGALRAIDDLLVDLSVNDFDVYVGTSAGALINSLIASGFNPREVMQAINNKHPELHGLRYGDAFHLNIDETLRRLTTLPNALWSIGNTLLRNAGEVAMADLLWELARVLPAGIYNGDSLERYVRASLETQGHPNSFSQLEKELYIVASELDSGARAVFGRGHIEDVTISRAVAASSAVPVLYRPVQIHERDYLDGGLHGAASLDLAIEAGAKMVVCINPMVPFDASSHRPNEHYIRQHGLQAVINQSLRTLLHSSLRYHIKNLRVKYPDVDIILIQPGLDDFEMFSRSPMHYSGRLAVAQHGFESVTIGLLRNRDYYASVMARHGIRLHTDLLEAELAALQQSGGDFQVVEEVIEPHAGHQSLSASMGHLEVRLKRLDQYVEMAEKRRCREMEETSLADQPEA